MNRDEMAFEIFLRMQQVSCNLTTMAEQAIQAYQRTDVFLAEKATQTPVVPVVPVKKGKP